MESKKWRSSSPLEASSGDWAGATSNPSTYCVSHGADYVPGFRHGKVGSSHSDNPDVIRTQKILLLSTVPFLSFSELLIFRLFHRLLLVLQRSSPFSLGIIQPLTTPS